MLELIYAVFVFVLSNTQPNVRLYRELGDKMSWVLYQ
jgi:hypothetical protein